jgi:hypothetical protein
MNLFIGSKLINAEPMTRLEYNQFRGWQLPEDEDGSDAGYLVEYLDGGAANTEKYHGYVSWSPEEVFENAYNKSGEMTFGDAIVCMKLGMKVSRAGWNGKGMWVIRIPGTKAVKPYPGSPYHEAGLGEVDILPHYDMYTVNAEGRRAMLPGWLASQSDVDASDWGIVE